MNKNVIYFYYDENQIYSKGKLRRKRLYLEAKKTVMLEEIQIFCCCLPGRMQAHNRLEQKRQERVLHNTMVHYAVDYKHILWQPGCLPNGARVFETVEMELYQRLLARLSMEDWRRVCLLLPGDEFFLLEEELCFLKEALEPYFCLMKALFIILKDGTGGVPPVLQEFMEYLDCEYGLMAQVVTQCGEDAIFINMLGISTYLDTAMKNGYNSLAVKREK